MTWPVGNIEYGSLSWLRREVALAASYPPDFALLDQTQKGLIDSVIESGMHRFYYPPPGEYQIANATEAQKERLRRAPHSWTFLQKRITLAMTVGQSSYSLPVDFAAFIGEPTTSRESGRISIAHENQLRQLIDGSSASGLPKYCAVSHQAGDGTAKPQKTLILYPTPAASETIWILHSIRPSKLDDSHPWPLSGTEHAETLLACCLYVLSERIPAEPAEAALAQQESARRVMMDRMATSIMIDQQLAVGSDDGIWVDENSEFSLDYLNQMVGLKAGYGPSPSTWTDSQRRKIAEVIRVAYRRVIHPPILPGKRYPHRWNWLSPVSTMTTIADQHTYEMPADFSAAIGPLTVESAENRIASPVRRVGEHQLRELIEREGLAGTPIYYATRFKNESDTFQTCEMLLYPIPDRAIEISWRYKRDVTPTTQV